MKDYQEPVANKNISMAEEILSNVDVRDEDASSLAFELWKTVRERRLAHVRKGLEELSMQLEALTMDKLAPLSGSLNVQTHLCEEFSEVWNRLSHLTSLTQQYYEPRIPEEAFRDITSQIPLSSIDRA